MLEVKDLTGTGRAMQHIQSLVNACLITLPGAVVMGLSPLITVLNIVFYVVLSANKLYALAVAEAMCGSTLGRVGNGDCVTPTALTFHKRNDKMCKETVLPMRNY